MQTHTVSKRFIVPYWTKVLFFWFSFGLFVLLVGFQIHKRWLYEKLYTYNVMQPISHGQMAPFFSLAKEDTGSSITLAYFGNKWILLHFWATWCPACLEEMSSLEWLHRQMKDKLVVLTASADEDWNDVNRFFNGQVPQMILGWDKDRKAASIFAVDKYPETFLISPDGKIIAQFSGPRDWSSEEAAQYLNEMIR